MNPTISRLSAECSNQIELPHDGSPGEIRTLTGQFLKLVPLLLGYGTIENREILNRGQENHFILLLFGGQTVVLSLLLLAPNPVNARKCTPGKASP